MSEQPVVLAVTSDQQAGSTTALAPPEGVRLDDGGRYEPSELNVAIWRCWESYWSRVDHLRTQYQAKLYCLFNGDLIEGRHHQSLQLIGAGHKEVQAYVIDRIFSVPQALKPDRLFVVRGTAPTHVGPLAEGEESLAREWGAERTPITRRWSWWNLYIDIHGLLIHAKHHPGTRGKLPWTRQQAYDRLAFLIWNEHNLAKRRPPDLAFRAHIHHWGRSNPDSCPTQVIVTPSWQAPTEYVHRIGVEDFAPFGGAIVVIQPDGTFTIERKTFAPAEDPVWTE